MQTILRHHGVATLLALLSLLAAPILPLGSVASAATAVTTACPSGGTFNNCFLAITAPDSVALGQTFPVSVALMVYGGDSPATPIPRRDFCARSSITLQLYSSTSDGPIAVYSATATAGVASFSANIPVPTDVSPGQTFSYYWYAFGPSEGPCSFDVAYYPNDNDFIGVVLSPTQPIAPCPANVVCFQTTNNGQGGRTAATLYADNGSFSAAFEEYDSLGCGSPVDPHAAVLNFSYFGTSGKTIVFALDPSLINRGIAKYQVCWESTNPFRVLGGGPAAGPNAKQMFVGYLPKCSDDAKEDDQVSQPCLLFRKSTKRNGALFGVLAPPDDPKGYVGSP